MIEIAGTGNILQGAVLFAVPIMVRLLTPEAPDRGRSGSAPVYGC